jgi:hypothetical protein
METSLSYSASADDDEEISTQSLLKICDFFGVNNIDETDRADMCERLREHIYILQKTGAIETGQIQKGQMQKGQMQKGQMQKAALVTPPKPKPKITKQSQVAVAKRPSQTVVKKQGFTRSQYRTFLRWAFTGFKVVLGAAATVFSFGGGADTLTDLLFTVADFGILSSSVVQVARYGGAFKKWVQRIYNLPWTGNPLDVKRDMEKVFAEIDSDPDHAAIYDEICNMYMGILDNIAALFGSLVSTMIPDDLGASRVVVQMIISQGKSFAGKKPFDALVYLFNKIPQKGRDTLKSKESIINLLNAIVSYLLEMLPSDSDTFFTRTKKHLKRSVLQHLLLPLVPGGILVMPMASTLNVAVENKAIAQNVSRWTKQIVEPNIPKFADLMMHVLPMTFAVTLMFSKCSQRAPQGGEITKEDIEQQKRIMNK